MLDVCSWPKDWNLTLIKSAWSLRCPVLLTKKLYFEYCQLPRQVHWTQSQSTRAYFTAYQEDVAFLLEKPQQEAFDKLKSVITSAPVLAYFAKSKETVLRVEDGMLFQWDRIVVPRLLRVEVLDEIHGAHMGESKSLSTARDYVFWPSMTAQIKDKESQFLCHV